MYYRVIKKERLTKYLHKVQELNFLYQTKHNIEAKCGIKGVNFSKTKVTNGDSRHSSIPEQYAIKLEKINKKIREARAYLDGEHEELVTQIARIGSAKKREALIYKYIDGWKMSDILDAFFFNEPDFEQEKNGKYQKKIERWIDEGIDELQKISAKPFIEVETFEVVEEQQIIEGLNDENAV